MAHGPAGRLLLLLNAQQLCGRIRVKLLDGFELAGDGAAAGADQLLQIGAGLVQVALHLLQTRAELFKLGLDRTQDRPDLAAALLDGQRAEAICRALSSAAIVDGPATVIW